MSSLDAQHRHSAEHTFHEVPSPASQQRVTQRGEKVGLDWGGLLHLIFNTPKLILAAVGAVAIVLFAILGPFLLLALVALVLFIGPFKQLLKPTQRRKMNQFITRTNAYVEERRKTGG